MKNFITPRKNITNDYLLKTQTESAFKFITKNKLKNEAKKILKINKVQTKERSFEKIWENLSESEKNIIAKWYLDGNKSVEGMMKIFSLIGSGEKYDFEEQEEEEKEEKKEPPRKQYYRSTFQELSEEEEQTVRGGKQEEKISEKSQSHISQSHKSHKSEKSEFDIQQLMKSHPKSMSKMGDIVASFQQTFQPDNYDGVEHIDPIFFEINERRERIYDRIKSNEQHQQLTASERNKLLYKEATRNGGQSGADLAVIENQHGIEEYRVKYPSVQQMLELKVVDQFAFDLAQKKHLTMVQTDLLQQILDSGESIVVPNIEFLRDEYSNKMARGEDYSKEFQKYSEQVVKQIGKQVAYYGEQDWSQLKDVQNKATKNFAAPALQTKLTKPKMIQTIDILNGIENIVEYISHLSGNLNNLKLKDYKKMENEYVGSIVQKEPTTFKPQPGMAFKLRELMC